MSMSGKLDANKKLAVGLVVAGAVGAAAWLAYKRANASKKRPPSPAKEPQTDHVEKTLPDEGDRKRISSTSTPPGEKELPREEQHYAAEDSPPEENNGSLTTTEKDGVVFVDRKPKAGAAADSSVKTASGPTGTEDISFDGSIITDRSIEEAKLATQGDCGTPHGCGEEDVIVLEAAITAHAAPSPVEAVPSPAETITSPAGDMIVSPDVEAKVGRVEDIIKAEHSIHKEASIDADSGHESDTVESALEEQIIQESIVEPESALQHETASHAAVVLEENTAEKSEPASVVENGHDETEGAPEEVKEPEIEMKETTVECETTPAEESESAPVVDIPAVANGETDTAATAAEETDNGETNTAEEAKENQKSDKVDGLPKADEEPKSEAAAAEEDKDSTPVVPMRNKTPKKTSPTANGVSTPKAPYADAKEDSSALNGATELDTVED